MMDERVISEDDKHGRGSGLKVGRDKIRGDGFYLWSYSDEESHESSIFLYDDEVCKLVEYFKENLGDC